MHVIQKAIAIAKVFVSFSIGVRGESNIYVGWMRGTLVDDNSLSPLEKVHLGAPFRYSK